MDKRSILHFTWRGQASFSQARAMLAAQVAAWWPLLVLCCVLVVFHATGCSESEHGLLAPIHPGDGSSPQDGTGKPPDPSAPPDSTFDQPPQPTWVEVDPTEEIIAIAPTAWFEGRAAACTFAFDDTRASHYAVAAPELEAHGFRGTFSLVTSQVGDWQPWQMLLDRGHEIANHTRDHSYFDHLSLDEIADEVRLGKLDLLANLRGLHDVPSFTYPGGACPPGAEQIIARYHTSGRVGQGLASADPVSMAQVPGFGYYDPFSVWVMNRNLDDAIAAGGWYIGYFHNVVRSGVSRLDCPLHIFRAHLDYAMSRSADLWVATQGEVADYISRRRNFIYQLTPGSPPQFSFETKGAGPGPVRPLTVEFTFKSGDSVRLTINGNTQALTPGLARCVADLLPGRDYPIKVEILAPPVITEFAAKSAMGTSGPGTGSGADPGHDRGHDRGSDRGLGRAAT